MCRLASFHFFLKLDVCVGNPFSSHLRVARDEQNHFDIRNQHAAYICILWLKRSNPVYAKFDKLVADTMNLCGVLFPGRSCHSCHTCPRHKKLSS